MQNTTSARRYSRHVFALVCSTGFLTIVPTALYGALIVWSGDLGGPVNLVIIPVTGAIVGLGISLVVFMPISLLAESSSLQRWQRRVGGLLVALTSVGVLVWIFVGTIKPQNRWFLAVGVCLYFVGGFFVYLCCLAVCRQIWPPSGSNLSGSPRIG